MSIHIGSEEIANLSSLAKLQLSEAEERSLAKDLEQILDYVAVLQAVKVDGVALAPAVHALSGLRADEIDPANIALPDLLPQQRLAGGLLETPNVFTSHESAKINNN